MVEVNGRGIEDVDRFVYLSATVSKEGGVTEDIHNRVVKARGVFLRLKKIWSSNSISRRTKVRLYKTLVKPVLMYGCDTWKMNKSDENKIGISRRTKVKLYKTLVKPVLMYGCETWKMNISDENKIDVFQSRCLRRIFKIRWQERITNKKVLMMAEMENLSEDVRRRRWKFIGHIMWKEPNNDCRTALTWTPEGRRKRGRPRTTWRRTAERKREKAGWKNWSEVQIAAADRADWRSCVEALCATWHEVDR